MTWRKKLGFLASYILPSLIVAGFYAGGFWTFSAFLFAYVFIPILDECIGRDPENLSRDQVAEVSEDRFFDVIVYSMVYIQLGLLLWVAYVLPRTALSTLEYAGLLLSLMTFTSGGINVAHELGHKNNPLARFHSKLNLMMVCYMHFYIEHNKGHHVHVATPQDPATSRKNQSFPAFWVQTVVGSWRSAWRIEKARLLRQQLPLWNPLQNQMLQFIFWPLAFVSVLTLAMNLGTGQVAWWIFPAFFFAQSLMAFSSLEAVNYIEHYGIRRREIAPGRYERVNPLHSWNSNHLVSNLMLFQLQRHSDHHAYAARPYQTLRHFDESPQLPFGYPVMILMALIPPLWFRVMNPRLEAWQAQAYDAAHIEAVVKATA
ncbi:MAG: alkane 1-monooxygenase [Microscillaceae bacterium]|nr:alkane 1-monooxygenase [Microscillaceae bacterium]